MSDAHDPRYAKLVDFVARIPAVETDDPPSLGLASGGDERGWWVKFDIDTDHDLAWNAVQELGHALNSLAPGEALATVFKPVSPPPDLNGGPEDYLSWVIEGQGAVAPDAVADLLEARLPQPVDDVHAWGQDDDDEDDDDEIGDGGDD